MVQLLRLVLVLYGIKLLLVKVEPRHFREEPQGLGASVAGRAGHQLGQRWQQLVYDRGVELQQEGGVLGYSLHYYEHGVHELLGAVLT